MSSDEDGDVIMIAVNFIVIKHLSKINENKERKFVVGAE